MEVDSLLYITTRLNHWNFEVQSRKQVLGTKTVLSNNLLKNKARRPDGTDYFSCFSALY